MKPRKVWCACGSAPRLYFEWGLDTGREEAHAAAWLFAIQMRRDKGDRGPTCFKFDIHPPPHRHQIYTKADRAVWVEDKP